MKSLFAAVAISLLTIQSSFAYGWYRMDARVWVAPGVVEAVVYNSSAYPIICNGYAVGQTYYGQRFFSYINNAPVMPFQYASTFVYTNAANPFINGLAEIYCRY